MLPMPGTANQSSTPHPRSRGSSYRSTNAPMASPNPSDNPVPVAYRPFPGQNGFCMMGVDQFGHWIPGHQLSWSQFLSIIASSSADGQSFNAQYPTGNGTAANPTMGSSNLISDETRASYSEAQMSFDGRVDTQFLGQHDPGMLSAGGLQGPASVLSPGRSAIPSSSPAPSNVYQSRPRAMRASR